MYITFDEAATIYRLNKSRNSRSQDGSSIIHNKNIIYYPKTRKENKLLDVT